MLTQAGATSRREPPKELDLTSLVAAYEDQCRKVLDSNLDDRTKRVLLAGLRHRLDARLQQELDDA